MPITPNGPNSNADIGRFSQTAENITDKAFGGLGKLTIKDVLGFGVLEATSGFNSAILLDGLIKDLDGPILKDMAKEVITTMSNWFNDPELLCCLIQGIWASYASTYSWADLAKMQKEGFSIADSKFGQWLDVLISFVDLVITFISSDLRKISIMIPDFLKEITNGVIGAILMVLQEVLFALRDSAINEILYQIDRAQGASMDMENIWAKCIPFAQLLDIIKKYVHDYGLFAELFEKIKGFISQQIGNFGYMKALDFPKNVKDIEFLYWFRDLLIKLKQAALNFDLCVNYGYAAPGGAVPQGNLGGDSSTDGTDGGGGGLDNPSASQGIKVASDGTILRDNSKQMSNPMFLLANSSIRTFLNKYQGYPLDYVDNLLAGSSSADSIKGTDINSVKVSDLNADCPNTPRPQELVNWALRIRNRNL